MAPVYVELVGPAGAGKSTLFDGLGRRSAGIFLSPRFGVRKVRNVPDFLFFGGLSLPVLLRQLVNDRRYSWEEVKKLIYLRGGRRFVAVPRGGGISAVLLDQGPVFELTRLHQFGPAVLAPERVPGWWEEMFERWAGVVDQVIWLDAENEVLVRRIRRRTKWHLSEELATAEALEVLERYRCGFEEIVSSLQARGRLSVMRIDTGKHSAEETLELALGAVEGARSTAAVRAR